MFERIDISENIYEGVVNLLAKIYQGIIQPQ